VAQPPRHYGDLTETHRQVDEQMTRAASQGSTSAPKSIKELNAGEVEALRNDYAQILGEKVEQGKAGKGGIPGNERTNMLARFDNGEPEAVKEAWKATQLLEARKVKAEAEALQEVSNQREQGQKERTL